MEFFQTLGSVVGDRWKARNYNEDVFPDVASQALAELPPAKHISPWDVVTWSMGAEQLPHQDDIEASFGDPPLTVYTGRKFRIEVLFWTEGTPSIHQHGFSGAFHVMQGSSIHSLWEFQPAERVESRLILGSVEIKDAELLLKGDSRPILAGDAMFHSTYHLDRPSISVVIRTLWESDQQPQYNLFPPSIALDRKNEIATIKRQTQILQMLLTAGKRTEFNEIARHLCATKDAYSVFCFLQSVLHSIEDETERQQLLLTARLRHPALIDALQPALEREEIGNRVLRLRERVNDSELKYFLALLRNVPKRALIIRLIEQRYPGRDPIVTIVNWVRKLSNLDVLPARFEEPSLLLLSHLLRDHSALEIIRLFGEHHAHGVAPNAAELRELCAGLELAWPLRSLSLSNPFDADVATAPLDGRRESTTDCEVLSSYRATASEFSLGS